MSYHPANQPIDGNCRVCGGMLAKEVTTIQHTTTAQGGAHSDVVSMQVLDYYAYVNPPTMYETQSITKVWCTACGIQYNPQ